MTDREKVIKGFELCITPIDRREYNDADVCHTECPYFRAYNMGDCIRALAKDALALLRSEASVQEPVKPTIGGDADGPCGNWWYQCGKCKEAIDYHDKYCRNCGQAVKWDG